MQQKHKTGRTGCESIETTVRKRQTLFVGFMPSWRRDGWTWIWGKIEDVIWWKKPFSMGSGKTGSVVLWKTLRSFISYGMDGPQQRRRRGGGSRVWRRGKKKHEIEEPKCCWCGSKTTWCMWKALQLAEDDPTVSTTGSISVNTGDRVTPPVEPPDLAEKMRHYIYTSGVRTFIFVVAFLVPPFLSFFLPVHLPTTPPSCVLLFLTHPLLSFVTLLFFYLLLVGPCLALLVLYPRIYLPPIESQVSPLTRLSSNRRGSSK